LHHGAVGAWQHETAGSDIVVITAGVRQKPGESRRDLLARNVGVFRSLVPPLAALSPDAVFVVVSNPVDVMTYITWRLSGLPIHRVLGSGTYLDSSRFRVLLASQLQVSPQSVHAQIIGEHGDSSVPVWSCANVAGVTFAHAMEQKGLPVPGPEACQEIHAQVGVCCAWQKSDDGERERERDGQTELTPCGWVEHR
jgi:L-lactate dehydrogenase